MNRHGRIDHLVAVVLRCAGGGLTGAAVGAAVSFGWWDQRPILWTVLGAAALGTVIATALAVATAPAPPQRPRRVPGRRTEDAWPPPPPPPPVPDRRRPAEAVDVLDPPGRLILPVDPAPATSTWWSAAPADRVPTAAAPALPAAPDLSTYREHARTVQCPRCGAFRIDVEQTDDGYAFRCRVDDHCWNWRAGTAWPATVVASRRRPAR